jgi:hypothetical protein
MKLGDFSFTNTSVMKMMPGEKYKKYRICLPVQDYRAVVILLT